VAGAGLGDGVLQNAFAEDAALPREASEAARERGVEPIAPQLIDCHDHDEPRRSRGRDGREHGEGDPPRARATGHDA
jgi:hypothetical protein